MARVRTINKKIYDRLVQIEEYIEKQTADALSKSEIEKVLSCETKVVTSLVALGYLEPSATSKKKRGKDAEFSLSPKGAAAMDAYDAKQDALEAAKKSKKAVVIVSTPVKKAATAQAVQ